MISQGEKAEARLYTAVVVAEEEAEQHRDQEGEEQQQPEAPANAVEYGEGGRKGWLTFFLVASAMFLMNGSYSIVMTVMPDIARDLRTDVASVVWVSLGTILGSTGAMPAAGMLGDVFGHAIVWQIGMTIRVATQVAAGLAPNLWTLVLARTVSGLGGALDGPTGT